LKPSESKSLSYSEIYWPTYVIILIAVVVIALVFLQSTAFTINKNVIGDKRMKSGKEISVSLNLKNKKREIDKAIVKDVVPSGFSIVSKFETVKPIIRKIADGIELNWKVSKLKPQEERVFHYTIKPVETLKERKLPSAEIKAVQNKKLMKKNSNKISLAPEKEETKVMTVKVSK
jgi:hypothetical protein